MKTKILIGSLAIFFFSLHTIHAQFTPGIKGGFNFASLSGYSGNDRVSAHAGFFLHHTINKNWCFQPELLYSGEGQRYFADGTERTIALDYVQVPLMVQYYPAKQLYFEFGPQLGILAGAKNKGSGVDINVKNDYASTQVGLNIGIGIKASNSLGFFGRYSFGLTDVTRFNNIVDQSRVGQVGMAIRLK